MTFSLDRGGFFRRACPSCGRHFKTKVDPGDLASMLQPAFRRLGLEVGEAGSEQGEAAHEQPEHLHCPYCGYEAKASDMLTATFQEYFRRYAMRDFVLPKINKMFSEVENTFSQHRSHSGGLFSLEVKFEHNEPVLPPRPISGPEPPDMMRVELLCCEKEIKILDGWQDVIVCPFCGTVTALQ
jgi:hypothetical protein